MSTTTTPIPATFGLFDTPAAVKATAHLVDYIRASRPKNKYGDLQPMTIEQAIDLTFNAQDEIAHYYGIETGIMDTEAREQIYRYIRENGPRQTECATCQGPVNLPAGTELAADSSTHCVSCYFKSAR